MVALVVLAILQHNVVSHVGVVFVDLVPQSHSFIKGKKNITISTYQLSHRRICCSELEYVIILCKNICFLFLGAEILQQYGYTHDATCVTMVFAWKCLIPERYFQDVICLIVM